MKNINGPLKVGIGGPVGAGKTSLTAELCKFLSKKISMAVISNDIYTKEDAEFLMKAQALPLDRIKGVETGGCPHTAIREDDLDEERALEAERQAKEAMKNSSSEIDSSKARTELLQAAAQLRLIKKLRSNTKK